MQWNGASCSEFYGKSMETKTTWSEFPSGGNAIVEQILASEERNISKRAELWESQSGIRVGKLAIWVRSFETEKLYRSSPGQSVPPVCLTKSKNVRRVWFKERFTINKIWTKASNNRKDRWCYSWWIIKEHRKKRGNWLQAKQIEAKVSMKYFTGKITQNKINHSSLHSRAVIYLKERIRLK